MSHRFPKHHIKILLGSFKAELGREYFQTDKRDDSLHQDINDNGVTIEMYSHATWEG